jgi:uncharacterized protein (DUF1800 family)
MSAPADRLVISRLINRFGFGPKPGEYQALLKLGVDGARRTLMTPNVNDRGLSQLAEPTITDLGPFPTPNTPAVVAFSNARRKQLLDLTMWWLDRMVLADNGLIERATWFWHGHWATSSGKVEYALPMKAQNDLLRKYALGNFATMAREMMTDAALLYWLDAQLNTVNGPNENLAREVMELFTLGVNNYSEDDIKNVARGLTGYQVNRSSGVVTFNPNRHDSAPITFLGNTGSYTAQQIADLLTSRNDSQSFITNRIWFRFMSTSNPKPASLTNSFQSRDTLQYLNAITNHSEFSNPDHTQVKSPVEWFVGVCRALKLQPSKLTTFAQVPTYLDKLGQVPFVPPNVGGWPYDEAWLNLSSAQTRLVFTDFLVQQGDLSPLVGKTGADAVQEVIDLLGIAAISQRTRAALRDVADVPKQLISMAVCSPEYLVNG